MFNNIRNYLSQQQVNPNRGYYHYDDDVYWQENNRKRRNYHNTMGNWLLAGLLAKPFIVDQHQPFYGRKGQTDNNNNRHRNNHTHHYQQQQKDHENQSSHHRASHHLLSSFLFPSQQSSHTNYHQPFLDLLTLGAARAAEGNLFSGRGNRDDRHNNVAPMRSSYYPQQPYNYDNRSVYRHHDQHPSLHQPFMANNYYHQDPHHYQRHSYPYNSNLNQHNNYYDHYGNGKRHRLKFF
ncbi:MAG: hypothetical protein EXX96DRAFT_570207 [Benjaminiella poitrasii]|nr:MAG: hypothetical protein EXX96DRAFT_570207 [Benjaminiella poitrasii]